GHAADESEHGEVAPVPRARHCSRADWRKTMKTRKTVTQEAGDLESHEEVRELAEALSRFRSAMTYAAQRASAQPQMAKVRPPAPSRFRLLLGPALGAVIAAGVL